MPIERIRLLDPLRTAAWGLLAAAALAVSTPVAAQSEDDLLLFTPDELEELVAPIALYPDDLLAVLLPASTYPLDVVEAARLLDRLEDNPQQAPDDDWDDSIVALLNYPEVLRLMDEDLDWTWDLGEAFLRQQADVLDAIQRFRVQAREAGSLTSDDRQIVSDGEGGIHIAPADPQVIYVPYYEPRQVIVHAAPIRYYPRPYPVYYYPYPAGYSFASGYFWGVTTAFVIGWHTHHLHVHPRLHIGHPYHRHAYYDPFYVRRSISINVVNVDRNVYVWQPHYHRIGARPGRVTITREGAVRANYGARRTVTRAVERQRPLSSVRSAAGRERTIGRIAPERRSTTQERRSTTQERRGIVVQERRGIASGERRSTARSEAATPRSAPAGTARQSAAAPRADTRLRAADRGAAPSSRNTANGARTMTREGVVTGLREARAPSRSTPRSNIAGVARSTGPAASARSGTSSRGTAAAAPRANERGTAAPSASERRTAAPRASEGRVRSSR